MALRSGKIQIASNTTFMTEVVLFCIVLEIPMCFGLVPLTSVPPSFTTPFYWPQIVSKPKKEMGNPCEISDSDKVLIA